MKSDGRKPTGVRITTSESNGQITFYLNRTAKKGSAQNSPHTIVQPLKTRIVPMSKPDAAKIGEAVLAELGLDVHDDDD